MITKRGGEKRERGAVVTRIDEVTIAEEEDRRGRAGQQGGTKHGGVKRYPIRTRRK
jgi:hypothetical protein